MRGQVPVQREGAAALAFDRCGDRGELVVPPGAERDPGPFGRECDGHRPPDAAARTENERHPAIDPQIH